MLINLYHQRKCVSTCTCNDVRVLLKLSLDSISLLLPSLPYISLLAHPLLLTPPSALASAPSDPTSAISNLETDALDGTICQPTT